MIAHKRQLKLSCWGYPAFNIMGMQEPFVEHVRLFWRDMPLARKGIVIVLLPLLLLLASLSFLYSKEAELSQLEGQLRIALENQRNIQAIHTQLLEASNGVRDFLLTDDKHFLDIFYQAQIHLPTIMDTLGDKLETKEQKERLRRLQPLVDQNLKNLQFLANSEADHNSGEMVEQFKMQVRSLDKLRLEIDELNTKEAALVSLDQNNVAIKRDRNFRITLFSALIGLISSVILLRVFLDTIVNRVLALRNSARHLANAEPLDLAFNSLDELGELSDELDLASQLLAKKVEETNQAKFDAEEANRSKTLFLSRTSHELRTPLNAILGFAQLLESDLRDQQQQNNAAMIRGAGEHLLKLINNVLDIASIESGERNLDLGQTNINLLVNDAVNYIAPLGRIRDIEITQNIAPNLTALADHQKLFQVVLNLLSNALKYGPVNSIVRIKAYSINEKVQIEVLDEGPGIPEALRKRLFTPFDRLGAEQSNIEGSGLGLALSKQIMTALGGSLEVSETQSLFAITLPVFTGKIEQKKQPTQLVAQKTMPDQAANQQTILLVEDNDSNKTLVEAILKRDNPLKLLHSRTLKSAKILLSQSSISMVILDLHLPDGNGESLVQYMHIHDEFTHIPIVILSADATPETIERLKQQGVAAYLTKPLNVAEFSRVVKETMSKADAAKETYHE